jgi:hypothetical protein
MPTQDQTDFLSTYGPLGDDISQATGLHPHLVLGHAAYESGWGKRHRNNNLFGISPGGQPASYPDVPAAAQAYVDLMNSPRYSGASAIPDPVRQARALTAMGYNSENPRYADTLASMVGIVGGLSAPQPPDDIPTLAQITVGGNKFTINQRYRDNFTGFLNDLGGTGYKFTDVQGYHDKFIAGTHIRSHHGSGAAIDINPDANPVNGRGGKNDLPADIYDMAQKWGLGWGGAWTGPKSDPMHFSPAQNEGGAYPIANLKIGQQVRFAKPGDTPVAAAPLPALSDPDTLAGAALVRSLTGQRAPAARSAPLAGAASPVAQPGGSSPSVDPDHAAGEALVRSLMQPAPVPAAAASAPAAAPAAPGGTTATGLARAAAAGLTDVGASVGNFLSDPVGNLGKMALTGGVFAHDAVAPLLGGQRFTDAQRHSLLDDEVAQPGTRAVNALGQAIGAPAFVPSSEAERLTRLGVGGAGTVMALGPGSLAGPALVGAGGAIGGDAAAAAAPDWAKPAAEIGGSILAGGAAGLAGAGTRAVARGGANALQAFVEGADTPKPAAPPAPPVTAPRTPANENRGWDAPVPRSAGAAATEGDTAVPLAEDLAHRSVAERARLNETQPSGPDRTIHIEGIHPTSAEAEQSVAVARELKALGIRSQEVSQEARDIVTSNNEKRQAFLQNEIIPSKVQLYRQEEATKAQIAQDYPAAFDGKQPVGAPAMQAVEDQIKGTLSDARGSENTHLQSYIKPLLDRLRDADGNFKSDPEALYGLREDLNRMRSKQSQSQDRNLVHVQGELGGVIKTLDAAIETGAPGYRNYMQNTAASLAKRDAMETLRGHESDFYDSQNRIQFSRVQRVMKDIVEGRDMPGHVQNGYKHIPPDVLDKLWALRDDLRRSATTKELASVPGSDTVQNTWDTVKGLAGGMAGSTVAHVAANAALGPLGSAAVTIGRAAIGSMKAGKQAGIDRDRGMNLLHPDPSTLRPRNALDQGG